MTLKEIEAKVRQFLIEELEIDEGKIALEARLKEDMGIDSLDLVDIVVIVDKIFGIRIKAEDMKSIVTLNDFCNYIAEHQNQ